MSTCLILLDRLFKARLLFLGEKENLFTGFHLPSVKSSTHRVLSSPNSGSCMCGLHVGSYTIPCLMVNGMGGERQLAQAWDEALSGFTCVKLVRTQAELMATVVARARVKWGWEALKLHRRGFWYNTLKIILKKKKNILLHYKVDV